MSTRSSKVAKKSRSDKELILSGDADGPCDYCRSIDEEYRLLRELCNECFLDEELAIPNLRRLIGDNQKPAFKAQTHILTPTMSLIEVSAESPLIDCENEPMDQGEALFQDVEDTQAEKEEMLLPETVNLPHDLGSVLADAHGEYPHCLVALFTTWDSGIMRFVRAVAKRFGQRTESPRLAGDDSAAYLYIGIAVRIVFALGFHLDNYSTMSGVTVHADLVVATHAFRDHIVRYAQHHQTPEMENRAKSLGEGFLDYDRFMALPMTYMTYLGI
ncbi:hypothetical protein FLAG1_11645 [Fusarium langsethiae]|uniref:Uncharacterized protein n=1 Tax=Fusarium langsethiae TaxID=179993 RepID=A0A0N0DAP8_FUSLA|nr:hypothetical protein FLAG1_11645 [Fusarium langsethiae]GKU13620.1 unnamed protein product [Fusarium langsethiae]